MDSNRNNSSNIRIHEEQDRLNSSSKAPSQEDVICAICQEKEGKYTCPKCDKLYCSLDCYKSMKHENCSEGFYKQNVKENLSTGTDLDEKKRMLDILDKFGDSGKGNNSNNEWKYEMPEDVKKKRKEIEDELCANIKDDGNDDELNKEDIEELEKVVDGSSVEELWGMLTEEEKMEFKKMIDTEGLH